jgi:hypothetical protein
VLGTRQRSVLRRVPAPGANVRGEADRLRSVVSAAKPWLRGSFRDVLRMFARLSRGLRRRATARYPKSGRYSLLLRSVRSVGMRKVKANGCARAGFASVLTALFGSATLTGCAAAKPTFIHVQEANLATHDDLTCRAYVVWNNEPVTDVVLSLQGSGTGTNAFVPDFADAVLASRPAAYVTFDKPGVHATFGDRSSRTRDLEQLAGASRPDGSLLRRGPRRDSRGATRAFGSPAQPGACYQPKHQPLDWPNGALKRRASASARRCVRIFTGRLTSQARAADGCAPRFPGTCRALAAAHRARRPGRASAAGIEPGRRAAPAPRTTPSTID